MTEFERSMQIIIGSLACLENDPGFAYRVGLLKDEEQMRIYRVPKTQARNSDESILPTKGIFVAGAMHPEKKQLCLAYCEFPRGGGESIKHATLAYDAREITKGTKHIVDYLTKGRIPVADQEYA